MVDGQPKIWPVILSGGSGTRLWPKSRTLFPKQFHVLTSEHSLLQEALLRVKDDSLYANPMVICNEEHRFIVAEQAEELNIELQDIVLEPEGRNTAPAVAVATALVRSMDPTGLVLVLAADHHIPKVDEFTAAVALGRVAASKYICTFGVTPTSPETGYGYIKRLLQEVSPGVFKIDQFKEKPDLATAKKYVADPKYAWNAGMFLFSAQLMQQELAKHEPSIYPACEQAIAHGKVEKITASAFRRLSGDHFAQAKAISLDFAVMEHTRLAAVIPLDASWTDVGSWPSLFQTCVEKPSNSASNRLHRVFEKGEVRSLDVKNCYLSTDGPLLAVIGVEDLCVVASDDAMLVLPMDRAQDVGKIAKSLNKDPRTSKFAQKHKKEYKPFGSQETLAQGPGFKVLQLTLHPGASTSLQMHYHRAMHQVVVEGTAAVSNGEESFLLHRNESNYISVGTTHRLSNPGKVPLVVIEVQSGEYLGDDDIVRIDPAVIAAMQQRLQEKQGMGLDLAQEDAEADAAFAPAAAPAASVSPGGTLTREPSAVFSSKPEARALKPSAAMAALAAAATLQQREWPSEPAEPPAPLAPPPPPLVHLLGAAALGAALVLLGGSFKRS